MEYNDNGEVSESTLWEAAKVVLREKIIALSSKLKKEREKEQLKLESCIQELEQEHKRTKNDNTLKSLYQRRKDLNELLSYKAEGALRFSNQKYYESGNRASRLLAFQLRKAQANRTVSKIMNPSSKKIVHHPKEIAEAFSTYYKTLYDSVETVDKTNQIKATLGKINLTKLSESASNAMKDPITKEEIGEVIKNLKNNKSPGVDGFPGEFYKHFKDEVTPLLQRVFNYALKERDPPKTWSEAIISVIPKEGRDPTMCASYRPISLLCSDVKILSTIISKRIQRCINTLIKVDQTGFIPGRQGINNIRKTLNIISAARQIGRPSMLLSLDAEKAFDRVREHTLDKMGFHSEFINWIKVLYSGPKSRVRVNGHTSGGFNLKRGTRQGCPLSPLLFAISIEPLAEMIREDPKILGVSYGGETYKISLYADDVILYISDPQTSIAPLLETLQQFGKVSGYKVNETKSEALMLVGNWPPELNREAHFKWPTQGFRYLGIMITPDTSQLYMANYGRLILQIRADLGRWKILPLSLFDRVEVIRMNVLPRLMYLFQALPIWISPSRFKMLEKMFSTFIWQGKRPRIRHKTLFNPKQQGGLNLPNLKLYYWAAQLRGMVEWVLQDEETNWLKLEEQSCPLVPLETVPFLEQKRWRKLKTENEWMNCTRRVWSLVRKKTGAPLTTSRAVKIAKDVDFLPCRLDAGFRGWTAKGLINISQLFDGGTLKSFTQLKDKYALTSKDFYRYLQLRNYLITHKEWNTLKQPPTPIEDLLIRNMKEKNTRKIVSELYKCLQTHWSGDSLHIKERWELEMNVIIKDEEWQEVCDSGHKITNSPMWKEFNWKIKMRYFKTPSIISTFDKRNNNLCWRNCGKIGDHTHIFWDCPKLKLFWEEIQAEIRSILGVDLALEPLFYIIGSIPKEAMDKKQAYLLHILLLVAKKMITVSWLSPLPPTLHQWRESLKKVYLMEKITAKLHLKLGFFMNLWAPVIAYFNLI
uniref:Reverse transcriptase domain-containing protein n=1 Tax=Amphiprion percula TaxID=161767 RepID=A0A3P8TVH1_AMPPE